jgi:hypothetical protein
MIVAVKNQKSCILFKMTWVFAPMDGQHDWICALTKEYPVIYHPVELFFFALLLAARS